MNTDHPVSALSRHLLKKQHARINGLGGVDSIKNAPCMQPSLATSTAFSHSHSGATASVAYLKAPNRTRSHGAKIALAAAEARPSTGNDQDFQILSLALEPVATILLIGTHVIELSSAVLSMFEALN
ncbi:hypothetical protein D9758_003164 [Tetrapyrgos nigripes]|uniref:Uncharacterized protein n=1 Tax=Tetrapyrgos nigripes TaxID=182062 RepID=A0A8H5GII4_9AGAR|nr:hypothetical protein D9758_003164 [Tetrapyrgos nigripes]